MLNAAFRQGIALPHGCKEGQCSACKCEAGRWRGRPAEVLDLRAQRHASARPATSCCAARIAYSDIEVELLNYRRGAARRSRSRSRNFNGRITGSSSSPTTSAAIEIDLDRADEVLGGPVCRHHRHHRRQGRRLRARSPWQIRRAKPKSSSFIIKKYPDGKFSGQLDGGGIDVGADVTRRGPYGTCFRREDRDGALILVGGRLGHVADLVDPARPHRQRREPAGHFFYGARTQADLFYLDRIARADRRPARGHLHPGAVARRRTTPTGTASAASSTRWSSAKLQGAWHRRRGRRLRLRSAADDRRALAGPVHERTSSPSGSSSTSSRRLPVRRPH